MRLEELSYLEIQHVYADGFQMETIEYQLTYQATDEIIYYAFVRMTKPFDTTS
jgi:hypothetical protein